MTQKNAYFNNPILSANGGLHNQKHYESAMALIEQCSQAYTAPRVYHITLHDNAIGVIDWAWTQLCKELKSLGVEHQWRSALEVDDDTGNHPGTHKHYFLILESQDRIIPHFLHPYDGGLFEPIQEKYKVQFAIHSPKNEIHNGKNFARISKTKLDKIHNVKIWISYLYKNRSKPDSKNFSGQIYSKSRLPKKSQPLSVVHCAEPIQVATQTLLFSSARRKIDVSSWDFSTGTKSSVYSPKQSDYERMKARYKQQKAEQLEAEFWRLTTDSNDYDPLVDGDSIEYLNHCTFGFPIDYAATPN